MVETHGVDSSAVAIRLGFSDIVNTSSSICFSEWGRVGRNERFTVRTGLVGCL